MRIENGIVVFDGVCLFCSRSMRFIIRHDRQARLKFAPMQSRLGQELLAKHGLDPADVQTFLLVEGDRAYVRSDAALEIARHLGGWRGLRVLRVIPRGIRDWAYGLIAGNRYRWFGRSETCFVPSAEERGRFLDV